MKSRIALFILGIALCAAAASAADFGAHAGWYWGDLKQWAVGVDAFREWGQVLTFDFLIWSRNEQRLDRDSK
jgi:hypothetical protein